MTLCQTWITEADLAACNCPPADPNISETMMEVASEIMFALTGQQWPGLCSETVYPCPQDRGYYLLDPGPVWTPLGESWPAVSTECLDTNGCGCGGVPVVRFDRIRITEVTEVMIGTEVLADTAYRLDIDRRGYALTRIDGAKWPCTQDVSDTLPNENSWSVSYTYGAEPPAHVVNATAVLAAEFIKGCIGDSDCRIPNRATTVTTEGVTYALLDPQQFLDEGRTGLWEVDLVIRAVNPGGINRRARIVSPESVNNRRVIPIGS